MEIKEKQVKESRNLNEKLVRKEEGITLVALVITVVIMLILAGVAIATVVDGDGLFSKTREATEVYENAVQDENDTIQSLMNEIANYLPIEKSKLEEKTNGSYDEEKKIHTPKLVDGMIAIYWENGVEKELSENSTELEWNLWYDYIEQTGSTSTEGSGTSRWANAITKDSNGNITGYYVWIPRYEYKITYNDNSDYSKGGIIDVNFIEIGQEATEGYIIHPVFQANPLQGGWETELPGFWIAKYPAGFQSNTVDTNGNLINGNDEVQYSNLYYTDLKNYCTQNALGQVLTNENYANERLSYPVFKPLTYVYNCINSDNCFEIAQEIKNATDFYGLNNADTHMMKNSEWGAVAYLTWSQYGRNATEPNINNVTLSNKDRKNIYSVTGIYADGTDNSYISGTFIGNTYNTSKGQLGSSTGNITGVYDLTGCTWEKVAAYVNVDNYTYKNLVQSLLDAEEKYKNVYLGESNDSGDENYLLNNFYGDGIRETSKSGTGTTSWNTDYSSFPLTGAPFFRRVGHLNDTNKAGIFAFIGDDGAGHPANSFRVVIIGTK